MARFHSLRQPERDGVVNFQDQIQPGTFEHALHYLVELSLIFRYSIQNTAARLRSWKLNGRSCAN
jgi:hypothetical protein